jgi:hypothetical protein
LNTPQAAAAAVATEGRFSIKAVAEVIGVSRSNLIERLQDRPKKRLGRPLLPDDQLVAEIKAVNCRIADLRLPAGPRHSQAGGDNSSLDRR